MSEQKTYVYDLEVYPNVFTGVFASVNDKKMLTFEISSRKNDAKALFKFLRNCYREKARFVGFNNVGFDWVVLDYFLREKVSDPKAIYDFAMKLIKADESEKFKYSIPESKHLIEQVDLYLLNHFNNKARATGLKMIEFNMMSNNIEDLPFSVGLHLTDEQIDTLIKYNKHDVKETYKFYLKCVDAIKFRESFGEKMGQRIVNYSDSKIGKEYFTYILEQKSEGSCYTFDPNTGRRKMRQTKRKVLDFSNIIFPYVKATSPELEALINWFKSQRVSETKGVFTDIEEHDMGELAKYANMDVKQKKIPVIPATDDKAYIKEARKRIKSGELSEDEVDALEKEIYGYPTDEQIDEMKKERPCSWIETKRLSTGKLAYYSTWRVAPNLNYVKDGISVVFGSGGIHASVSNATFYSDDEWVIVDVDVTSMYPSLFIANNVYPKHLGEDFVSVYQQLKDERMKHPKGSDLNYGLKIALNSVYGSTNDKFSPFYDPLATMKITVNGQLSLAMLADEVLKIEGLQIVQINTDGLSVYMKRKDKSRFDEIIKEWETTTGMDMEEATYSMMAIRDVNNYIAVYEGSGKIKLNGAYEYRREELGYHQNQSALIIKEAAVKEIIKGTPVEHTIRSCKNKWDFMLRTKVPRSSRLVLQDELGVETPEQNICRYYIANEGKKLVKIMPPLDGKDGERRIGIDQAWEVKTCNNIDDFDWDINYDYYIQEAIALVKGVGLRKEGVDD